MICIVRDTLNEVVNSTYHRQEMTWHVMSAAWFGAGAAVAAAVDLDFAARFWAGLAAFNLVVAGLHRRRAHEGQA